MLADHSLFLVLLLVGELEAHVPGHLRLPGADGGVGPDEVHVLEGRLRLEALAQAKCGGLSMRQEVQELPV